ncbi:Predicted house-cleaning noncanonical NTP pyrophosphatase, all-alpha NTP-PPase (MazG) superfamily [Bacillus sp. 491mf]|uniref:nucleoside triphosphate pyrophosphohydrolase n=1 Tax=Bacillus sp. 491mf TaxID=1761755 RepID=UPI0008F31066|nr:nucleoside triphosphate pyrophosphohydrolase [Bacillus sp. 491mf]SFD32709.1 Predicted house-cleaning noncanonical NTP pyrophosphatase, all-alpha NTP-PPase (MazG) superfamily [Bacillus sp. 491mf]
MSVYNKIVRDRVPEMILMSGKTYTSKKLSKQEYIKELSKIGIEEMREFASMQEREHAVDSLADALEVIKALAKAEGVTLEDVERVRQEKEAERGGFEKGVYLVEVSEE